MSRTAPLGRDFSGSRSASPLPSSSSVASSPAFLTPPVSVLVHPIEPRSHTSHHTYDFCYPRSVAHSTNRDLCKPRSPEATATASRGKLRRRHRPSSRARALIPSPLPSPLMAPDSKSAWLQSIQAAVTTAVAGNVTMVGEPQPVVWPSRPKRMYGLALSDGRKLFFVNPASPDVRTLRSERKLVESEAAVLKWLKEALTRERLALDTVLNPEPPAAAGARGSSNTAPSRRPSEGSRHSDSPSTAATQDFPDLLDFVPSVLCSSATTKHPDPRIPNPPPQLPTEMPYSILTQPRVPSIPASLRQPAFEPAQMDHIDFQVGRLAGQLLSLTSPSGRFGPVKAVLPLGDPSSIENHPSPPNGPQTWTLAFHCMLEAVFRDAEDMAINLPYSTMREHFRRLSPALDNVTIPRLVMVDAGSPSSILVPAAAADVSATTVTGITGWCNCVFGDPLFMRVFSETPSKSFIRGFNGDYEDEDDEEDEEGSAVAFRLDYRAGRDEDDRHARSARLLLYQIYHHCLTIVQQFYRWQAESSAVEMGARARLRDTLMLLNEMENHTPGSRHRRPSLADSPAKRLRTGNED